MSENQQETKVVDIPTNGQENKKVPDLPKENMYLISEKAVNQLLNTVAELQGLTWKQTNPIIMFIQQNVVPFKE